MTSVIETQGPGTPPLGASGVAVLPATAPDTEALLAMLGRCSRASLFHRFHGFTDGVAYFSALLRDRPAGKTLLAWSGSTCVAVGTLGADSAGLLDLGVLVEDAWQRRGIGTRLIRSLLDDARAKGVTTVRADVLADDEFILRALRRIGRLRVSAELGSFSIDIDLGGQPRAGAGPVPGSSPVITTRGPKVPAGPPPAGPPPAGLRPGAVAAPALRRHLHEGPLRVLVGKERFSENHAWSEMPRYWPASLVGRVVIEVVGQGRLEARLADGGPPVDVVVPLFSALPGRAISAGSFGLIQQFGAGVDNIDLDAAADAGVWVANMPGLNAVPVAEHAVALLLALARRLPEAPKGFAPGQWGEPAGRSLSGTVACIVGAGAVGTQIARRLAAFNVTVNGVRRHPPDGIISPFAAVYPTDRLLDADAAIAHLNTGHLAGIGLDVFPAEPYPADGRLVTHPRIVATAHTAALTSDYFAAASRRLGDALAGYLDHQPPAGLLR